MLAIVELMGGLGNQLFQYAIGRRIALLHNCRLAFDVGLLRALRAHNGYELMHFAIEPQFATRAEVRQFGGPTSRAARRILRALPMLKPTVITETDLSYDASVLSRKPPLYLRGTWQSYRYFEPIAEQIRSELVFRTAPTGRNAELVGFARQPGTVSIHVRRGDYVTNPRAQRFHGFVGGAYYDRAIAHISSRLQVSRYFVFSDDIDWARNHFRSLDDAVFIDHNSGAASFEDMRIMTHCSHNIVANSSFSWWGAWLGDPTERTVVYPRHWFASNARDTSSLCPPDWIAIE